MFAPGSFVRVFVNQASWHALLAGCCLSVARCVVMPLLCLTVITAAAFITLHTLLWWRWSRIRDVLFANRVWLFSGVCWKAGEGLASPAERPLPVRQAGRIEQLRLHEEQ